MKKIISIIAAAALILTAAGCNGETDTAETTAAGEATSGKTHTQVAYSSDEGDTTEEALEYLREYVPLYVKFMEKRMMYPLVFETSITESGESLGTAGIYILDDHTLATSSTTPAGETVRLVFKGGMVYQIESATKTVYSREYTEENAKSLVSDYLIKINLSEVEKCSFVDDYEELNGVTYKHEIIYSADGDPSNYYYDEATEEIKYIRIGEQISEVLRLENTADESAFEIPSDYEMKDFSEYDS